jgi:hypothetical protein
MVFPTIVTYSSCLLCEINFVVSLVAKDMGFIVTHNAIIQTTFSCRVILSKIDYQVKLNNLGDCQLVVATHG